MDTAGKAPMPVVFPPAAAEPLLVFLRTRQFDRWLCEVRSQLRPEARWALEEGLRQLQFVASWSQEWGVELRVSGHGSAEVAATEVEGGSPQEIDPEEAAVLLSVSPSRVRQLCRARELVARRVGRSWLIDRASVQLRAMGAA